jgi:hypothetical protein
MMGAILVVAQSGATRNGRRSVGRKRFLLCTGIATLVAVLGMAAVGAVAYADHVKAPLFIIQGATDQRMPKAESDQIVQRL